MFRKIIANGMPFCINPITGIERVARDTLFALDDIVQKGEIEIVFPRNAKNAPKFKNISAVYLDKDFKSASMWEQFDFQKYALKSKGIPLDFCNTMPYFVPGIAYIHDIYSELFPKQLKTFKKKVLSHYTCKIFRRIAKKACKIVTVSEFSKQTIVDSYKIDSSRVAVIPNGISQMYVEAKADDGVFEKFPQLKGKDFYFMLGALSHRKNLNWILRHSKLFPDELFAISGNITNDNEEPYLQCLKNRKNVILLGYLSDGQSKALMQKCKAFVFPSLFEGFGMPPLEALQSGAKIIISNATALPQIYKGCAHYIDPKEPNVDLDELLEQPVESPEKLLGALTARRSAQRLYQIIKEVWAEQNKKAV